MILGKKCEWCLVSDLKGMGIQSRVIGEYPQVNVSSALTNDMTAILSLAAKDEIKTGDQFHKK